MTQFIENGKLNIGSSKKKREKNLGHLLEYIYRNFSLDHDVMKDIYKDVKVPVDFDYEDSVSEDYDEYYRNNLNFVGYYQEDDEYVFRYDGKHFDPENFDNNPLINKVHEFLQSNSPEELRIGNFESLQLDNDKGVNSDCRGIRSTDWKLYYWDTYKYSDDSGITLDDLIVAAYKIKSHKFDTWYELFGGVEFVSNNGDCLWLKVGFDHGS